ncbi:MAG: hisH, partial [Firmicutes bacterium]|nr:hisH [Bacillota bacterium]
MRHKVTVVDYGVGNLLSVCRALTHNGADVITTEDPEKILEAERLVLPGVGAYADAMNGLRVRNLVGAIQQYAQTGRPFLGICLGMQMMLDNSEEFGSHEGLGLIPGSVIKISATDIDEKPHKVPHIGWNTLKQPAGRDATYWQDTLLRGLQTDASVYFVHSFTALPSVQEHRLADTYYGGRLISAVIHRDNLYGCQFHPEK